MFFVSVAQACRDLGIDAKTLHRWLAQAQLALCDHPQDGRKKGVSQQQLLLLAHLHQRHLPASHEEPSAPQVLDASPPSAAWLAWDQALTALQTQVATVQQQIAQLTERLTAPAPTSAASVAQPGRMRRRAAATTHPAPRARSASQAPRKPVHVIPRVEYGQEGRYVVICPKRGMLLLEPDTPEWFAWVAEQSSFRFVGKGGYFTAHHWWRVPKGAWRAHRHLRNQNHVLRLAPNHELTIAVLEQAALALQARLS